MTMFADVDTGLKTAEFAIVLSDSTGDGTGVHVADDTADDVVR